jgi:signal transduction histidine kinase
VAASGANEQAPPGAGRAYDALVSVVEPRPRPEQYQPTIGRRGHLLRYLGMLAIALVTWSWVAEGQWEEQRLLFWLDLALAVPAFVLVAFRRRAPFAIAAVLNVMGIGSALVAGPSILASVSLATRRRRWEVGSMAVIIVVCITLFWLLEPVSDRQPWPIALAVNLTVAATQLGWGMFIGSRRELVWTLQRRAERAEADRDLRAEQARSTERTRIAREMHDVLAHRISQVSMHAGALAYRDDLEPEEMRANAAVIQATAHEALTELRSVLGVLRDAPPGSAPERPQPTYGDLTDLVDEARSLGTRIDFRDDVDREHRVPDPVGRTVYRIVQEGITNVRKHAPGSELTVRLSGGPGPGLRVVLRNPVVPGRTPPPGAGLGLVGLSERAELRGGRLGHGTTDGVFWLRVWIPWAT